MLKILFVSAAIMAAASPAMACRGTDEYPQTSAALERSELTPADKAALAARLEEGRTMHDESHKNNDNKMMRGSLAILDEVRKKLGM